MHIAHADAALLSPIFATRSHPKAHPLTAARARLMARNALLPVLALGGVTARNAPLLKGFAGIRRDRRAILDVKIEMQKARIHAQTRRAMEEQAGGARIIQSLPAAGELPILVQHIA